MTSYLLLYCRHMRQRNRGMARRWLVNLQRVRPDVARLARAIDEQDRVRYSLALCYL